MAADPFTKKSHETDKQLKEAQKAQKEGGDILRVANIQEMWTRLTNVGKFV